ncbi:MAG: hypothetical protein IKI75_09885 [Lachnospiraceae bacterium]|nr:hypothetical protein [Lachnospiraceae bacterium]
MAETTETSVYKDNDERDKDRKAIKDANDAVAIPEQYEGTDKNWLVYNTGRNVSPNFNFMLRVEGLFDLPCRKVHNFTKANEYEYIQEGGLNDYVHMRRKPVSQPFTFQVERYVGVDYIDPLQPGTDLILPIVLMVWRLPFYKNFTPFRVYTFTGCTVMSKDYGELNAESSGLLTETTTIAYRELLRVTVPDGLSSLMDPNVKLFGRVVDETDEDGNIVYLKDRDGKPITDSSGKMIAKKKVALEAGSTRARKPTNDSARSKDGSMAFHWTGKAPVDEEGKPKTGLDGKELPPDTRAPKITPATDENGNPVDGTKYKFHWDGLGKTVEHKTKKKEAGAAVRAAKAGTDDTYAANGEDAFRWTGKPPVDEDGNPMKDEDGNELPVGTRAAKVTPATDEEGNPVDGTKYSFRWDGLGETVKHKTKKKEAGAAVRASKAGTDDTYAANGEDAFHWTGKGPVDEEGNPKTDKDGKPLPPETRAPKVTPATDEEGKPVDGTKYKFHWEGSTEVNADSGIGKKGSGATRATEVKSVEGADGTRYKFQWDGLGETVENKTKTREKSAQVRAERSPVDDSRSADGSYAFSWEGSTEVDKNSGIGKKGSAATRATEVEAAEGADGTRYKASWDGSTKVDSNTFIGQKDPSVSTRAISQKNDSTHAPTVRWPKDKRARMVDALK